MIAVRTAETAMVGHQRYARVYRPDRLECAILSRGSIQASNDRRADECGGHARAGFVGFPDQDA
jgi:hypothetical protein